MTDRKSDLHDLYETALAIESLTEREAFLDRSCGGDSELRRDVGRLLQLRSEAELAETMAPNKMSASASSLEFDVGRITSLDPTLDGAARVVLRDSRQIGDDPILRPTSAEMPDRSPDRRYRLDGEIARGGMGAILKGRDVDLGRDLAIKVLLDRHKGKPDVVQRFVEEAQIAGQLQHPGIAPVYELGHFEDERPFFSMKLIKGETLAALLAARENPSEDRSKFLGIFEHVCQTIAYAHSRGVIHRDLKPANIMVGAFGEVQVMDWGLAKVLPAGGVADELKAQNKPHETSTVQTLRSGGSEASGTFASVGSQTQTGSVMGTPAYMPPEQALGEIGRLDERSDVFGLGAILAEIFSGRPPYVGDDGNQVFRMASDGELEECFKRLDGCGVDDELVRLAKQCLSIGPSDRPRNADAVAERISGYVDSIARKLRDTEMEQVAQAARAREKQKRRRVTLALAASLLLMLTFAAGVWAWMGQQENQRRLAVTDKVNEKLNDARLHQRLADVAEREVQKQGLAEAAVLDAWLQELDEAVRSAEQAVEMAAELPGGMASREPSDKSVENDAIDLLAKLKTAYRLAELASTDRTFQEELDLIRLSQAETLQLDLDDLSVEQDVRLGERPDGRLFDIASAAPRYEKAFREAGLDLAVLEIPESVDRIRNSVIRGSIIAALDNWIRAKGESGDDRNLVSRAKLLRVVNTVDASTWRKRLRAALNGNKVGALRQLAVGNEVQKQSPELIAWLGAVLRKSQELDLSLTVLRAAQLRHPGDFWLNYELGRSLRENDETIEGLGYTRAALAKRPQSFGATMGLGDALREAERYKEAIAIYRTAVRLSPNHAGGHNNLGDALRRQNKLNEAIAEYYKAIELDPTSINAYNKLGNTLRNNGRLKEAITVYEMAIENDKKNVFAHPHICLGHTFKELGNLKQAVTEYRNALRIDPKHAQARNHLSLTLERLGKFDEAIAELRHGVRLEPNNVDAHRKLCAALQGQGKMPEAIASARRLIAEHPANAGACNTLAWLLVLTPMEPATIGDFDDAVRLAQKATEINPNDASFWNTLGVAYYRIGQWRDASVAIKKSIRLGIEHPSNWLFLAMAEQQSGNEDQAQEWYNKALAWRGKNSRDATLKGFFAEAALILQPVAKDERAF